MKTPLLEIFPGAWSKSFIWPWLTLGRIAICISVTAAEAALAWAVAWGITMDEPPETVNIALLRIWVFLVFMMTNGVAFVFARRW